MRAGTRTDRIAEEIRYVVGDILVRQEIKDPAVRSAGIITVSHVKMTGDLRLARIAFMVFGADEKHLAAVAEGLNRAAGYIRRRLKEHLRVKVIPDVEFVIDRVYASEARVDQVLRDIEQETRLRSSRDERSLDVTSGDGSSKGSSKEEE